MNPKDTNHEITDFDYMNLLGEAYRLLIQQRYDFNSIQKINSAPNIVTKDKIDQIRIFYLNDLYPNLEERIRLITLFDSFREHLHFNMLLKIAGQLIGSVLKFGLYLPLVIKIVYLFFKAYIDLKQLEPDVIKKGKNLNLYPPFSIEDLLLLFKTIPKDKLLTITKDIISIIDSFIYNINFIETVEVVLKDIEKTMQNNPTLYPKSDIEVLQIGIRIVSNGLLLLKSFPNITERKKMIQFIFEYEIQFIADL